MNNEFEKAFNNIIMHNYNAAYNRFDELYRTEPDNASYLHGCVISLILMRNVQALNVFIQKESANPAHRDFLNVILGRSRTRNSNNCATIEKSAVFDILISFIEAMRSANMEERADPFIRTAQVLRPNDSSLFRYQAERAFRRGSIESGCSFLVRASKVWAKSK